MRVHCFIYQISKLSADCFVLCAERPIRSFEVLADVCNSWVTDKTVNVLMAKKTPLAVKLSRAVSVEKGSQRDCC